MRLINILICEKLVIRKRTLVFLLCGTVAVFSVVLAVVIAYQKAGREPMVSIENHKNAWIDLLTNNNEVLPYLELPYTIEDELIINYRYGELTINESSSNMFSS